MAATQNTLIMMPGDVTKSTNIKPSNIEALAHCSCVTGIPLSRLLDSAIDMYLECEAPIYMHKADPSKYGWGERVRAPRARRA